jgi:hypothetical protein
MRKRLLIVISFVMFYGFISAPFASATGNCQLVSKRIICSDGSTAEWIGNRKILNSDKSSLSIVGNKAMNSKGTQFEKIGNKIFYSDGSKSELIGNRKILNSNKTSVTISGNKIMCNGFTCTTKSNKLAPFIILMGW